MAASTFQSAQNVKFGGATTNVVLLKNTGGIKTFIDTNKHTAADIALLDALIAAFGAAAPMASAVAGKATANFNGAVVGGNATGLQNVGAATAGTATINVGGAKTGPSATGLTSYAGTAGFQYMMFSTAKSGASATGLTNDATVYTASITVDGVVKGVSVAGTAAQTFTTLLTAINTALGAAGTAAIVNGNLKVTSASVGSTSTVSIASTGNLLSTLANFVGRSVASAGSGAPRKYSALVVVDGVAKSVNFTGVQGNTYTNLITEINTDLGGAATAALTGGNVVITSATTGAKSSVVVYDSGLFGSLTNFAGVTQVAGTAPRSYTASIVVDGVVKPVSVQGSAAQTFTTLITALNTAIGAAGTAAITGGNIVVTSATTGATSTVVITDGDLFKSLNGFFSMSKPLDGVADLLAVLQRERMPNGTTYAQFFKIEATAAKPPVPIGVKKTKDFIYHDGTVWRYLLDDTAF